jgi:P4 family phage/plasmid primase-like protien
MKLPMPQDKLPSPAVLAEEFTRTSCVVWFQEDIYCFSYETGTYQKKPNGWLDHHVSTFLLDFLGSNLVDASLVSNVSRVIKNLRYVDSCIQPPFWLKTKKPADVFVTSNGIIAIEDVVSGAPPVLVAHTPDLFAVCGVPYRHEPNATCPQWLKFVRWMVGGNEDEVTLLQQFCAWVLIAWRLKLEKFLWLCGPGRNGKSTFLQIVRFVFGEDATSAVGMDAFHGASTFRLSPTLHKLANFCFDAVVRRNSDVAGLNSYVSNDPFTINRKFQQQVTIAPTTVCFFASNPRPSLNDPSDAFWRRLLLIYCDQHLAEKDVDPTLLKALKDEAPGILNWMLSAVPVVLQRKRFDVPASVLRNVEELKAEVNSVRQFISDKMEAGDGEKDFISQEQLMISYAGWCKLNQFKEESFDLVQQEIRREFGVKYSRGRRGEYLEKEKGRRRKRGWDGIRWQENEDPPKSTRDYFVDNLNEKLAERDAEIRKLKSEVAQQRPVKEVPATRHTTEVRSGEAAPTLALPSSPDRDDDISSDDIRDLLAQLSADDSSAATSTTKEGSTND